MDWKVSNMSNAKENFKSTSELLDLILKKSGEYTISCGFGYRDAIASIGTTAGNHPGADIPLTEGTQLYAPFDGIVTATRNNVSAYGKDIFIYNESLGITFFAGHLSSQTVGVGESVKAGDKVALTGNTGQSTGPHLHFGIYLGKVTSVTKTDSKWVDPVTFVIPTVKKSNEEIAAEIKLGLWGNGTDRKNRLAAAGYDYAAVQTIVNGKTIITSAPAIEEGSKVKIKTSASKYATGQAIPSRVKSVNYTIQKKRTAKAWDGNTYTQYLLKEISSWVVAHDVESV